MRGDERVPAQRRAGRVPAEDERRAGTGGEPADCLRAQRDPGGRVLQGDGDVTRDVLIADVRDSHADIYVVADDYRAGSTETRYRDVGDRRVDRDRHEALVVRGSVIGPRLTCYQVVIARRARRPGERHRRAGARDEPGDALRADRHVLRRVLQCDVEGGDVLVADVFHGDRDARRTALHRGARSTDARHGQVGQRSRRRRRKAVDHDAEALEHEIDPVGDRDARIAGEQQRDGVEIRVVGHDERARVSAVAEPARRDDQLVHIAGGLRAGESRNRIADRDGRVDARDLTVRQPRGAAVLLHVQAEQRVAVIE